MIYRSPRAELGEAPAKKTAPSKGGRDSAATVKLVVAGACIVLAGVLLANYVGVLSFGGSEGEQGVATQDAVESLPPELQEEIRAIEEANQEAIERGEMSTGGA